MALLSAVIAVPFEFTSRRMTRVFAVLETAVAVVTVAIGAARL
jgi:hypothetical protein